jgi:hypothetical protein
MCGDLVLVSARHAPRSFRSFAFGLGPWFGPHGPCFVRLHETLHDELLCKIVGKLDGFALMSEPDDSEIPGL